MKKRILWIITIVPLILTFWLIRYMPDKIPAHYDIKGNIDRWGSKYEIFIVPMIIIVMTGFWNLLISVFERKAKNSEDEKKKAEYQSNIKVLYIVAIQMVIMFSVIGGCFAYSAIVSTPKTAVEVVDVNGISSIVLGVTMLVLGNYLPKTKRNSVVGFRTSITMKNEENWKKCNKFAGMVMMLAGIIIVTIALTIGGSGSMIITILMLVLAVVISLMYASKMKENTYED